MDFSGLKIRKLALDIDGFLNGPWKPVLHGLQRDSRTIAFGEVSDDTIFYFDHDGPNDKALDFDPEVRNAGAFSDSPALTMAQLCIEIIKTEKVAAFLADANVVTAVPSMLSRYNLAQGVLMHWRLNPPPVIVEISKSPAIMTPARTAIGVLCRLLQLRDYNSEGFTNMILKYRNDVPHDRLPKMFMYRIQNVSSDVEICPPEGIVRS
jgi:hypothetical protein